MAKIAINGLGRIGRATLKLVTDEPALELVAVNDLVDVDSLAYLLRHDSVYGRYTKNVSVDGGRLIVDGHSINVFQKKDPSELPWGDLGIDVVFECTGIFRTPEAVQKHVKAGAKRAILSAPSKSEGMPFVVPGVTTESSESLDVCSCASCTTNCIAPVVEIVGRRIGIAKALMSTVHAYTSSQKIVDGPAKKWERGRAGAVNIVPTTTGAAQATTAVLPQYEGRFDGVAIRVPIPVGSIADITFVTERKTSVQEVNDVFREEAESERYKEIVGVIDYPVVSMDIVQDSRASIVDLSQTRVVGGDLLKVMSWYDNEWGYASQMVRQAVRCSLV